MNLSLEKIAGLARLAYEPDMNVICDQLQAGLGVGRWDMEFIYVPQTDTEGFMVRLGNDCLMAFSGTESLRDLQQDLFFLPIAYHGGHIHSGFKQIIDDISDPIIEGLHNLFRVDPVRQIHATGHSLGAPIAMGACDILYFLGLDQVFTKITTFGCPNGWSHGAMDGFNRRHPDTTNYINYWDPVTWLLGVTTGRPGNDIKLSGKWGHKMAKYEANIKNKKSPERCVQGLKTIGT